MPSHTDPSSFDDAFDALADPRRRELLVSLLDRDSRADPRVADDEHGSGDLLAMEHVHLPKLDAYGFVRWDRESGEVTRGPAFDELRPLLELFEDHREELPSGWP